MPEMGTLPIDWTVCLFSSVLNGLSDGLTFKATERMEDAFDVALAESWASLQISMGERLQRDLDAGRIDQAKFDFALLWLSDLGHIDFEESIAQFFMWVEWVRS